MKFDFSGYLLTASDEIHKEEGKIITHLAALKSAILADASDAADKLKRFEIFLKLKTHTLETEYEIDEVSLLDKAALALPTLFAGQLHYLLSGKSATK
jgi:hypothetical protein